MKHQILLLAAGAAMALVSTVAVAQTSGSTGMPNPGASGAPASRSQIQGGPSTSQKAGSEMKGGAQGSTGTTAPGNGAMPSGSGNPPPPVRR